MNKTNDHSVGGDRFHSADDTDAALSLCALGRLPRNESTRRDVQLFQEIKECHSLTIKSPTPNTPKYAAIVSPMARSPASQTVVQDLTPLYSSLEIPKKRKVATLSRKNNMKPKDPKRDTSVSFEEMKRLMRVYGPIKALRSHAIKDTGKEVKSESIRRKFYRWFPDFNERFVKSSDGLFTLFTPKDGHQQEMDYRKAMREMDKHDKDMAKKRIK